MFFACVRVHVKRCVGVRVYKCVVVVVVGGSGCIAEMRSPP